MIAVGHDCAGWNKGYQRCRDRTLPSIVWPNLARAVSSDACWAIWSRIAVCYAPHAAQGLLIIIAVDGGKQARIWANAWRRHVHVQVVSFDVRLTIWRLKYLGMLRCPTSWQYLQ